MNNIFDKLKNYSDSDYYAFHMPGHKRNLDLMDGTSPYRIDITEIDGFDDLHHAEGILRDAQERAARVYHADETHFLVNGSTVGILSAILGTTEKGDSILVARNCPQVCVSCDISEMNWIRPTSIRNSIRNRDLAQRLMLRMYRKHWKNIRRSAR